MASRWGLQTLIALDLGPPLGLCQSKDGGATKGKWQQSAFPLEEVLRFRSFDYSSPSWKPKIPASQYPA